MNRPLADSGIAISSPVTSVRSTPSSLPALCF
jgi:hypothetical protein